MTISSRTLFLQFTALAAALCMSVSSSLAQDVAPAPGPEGVEGVEVLTRGVVHEAFAEVIGDPRPGLVIAKRPPEPIDEVPPEFKPEGDDAIWISGYWVWDDERDDFFWQSGVWRVPPPGMRWVAGYWSETAGGWQWISGFWVEVGEKEIRYYDDPPPSLEAGPSSPSPGGDYFWAPGSWTYDTGYRWQPGYWAPYREDWVWISARYVWTPAGCVYLPGRWDYRLTRRGCLFAPIYFQQPIYLQPNYVYRPWCALNTQNLFVHLWVRPNYSHFYFGNYYGSNWGNWGFTPWSHYRPYRNCYDPVLTQLQCHYRRQGVNYIDRLDGWHNHYSRNSAHRPPRTWNEQVTIVNKTRINNTVINNTTINNVLAVNVQDEARRKDLPVKLARLDSNMQKKAREHVQETRDLRKHRIALERPTDIVQNAVRPDGKVQPGLKTGISSPSRPKPAGEAGLKMPREDRVRTADGGQPKPRQANKNMRLALPETVVADAIKGRENHAPPKLTQPKGPRPELSQPGVARPTVENPRERPQRGDNRNPGERNPMVRPEVGSGLPKPRLESSTPQPRLDIPNPRAKVEVPKQPRLEIPKVQPRVEASRPQPRLEVPRPQPRPNVEIPKPQPRLEVPRPQPQPKVENPRPQPRTEVPRPQPRIEVPRPQPRVEAPRPPRVETPRPNRTQLNFSQPAGPRGGGNPAPRVESRERPQIKLDIPRPAPRVESAPRVQPAPRMEPAPRIQSQPRVQPQAQPQPRVQPQAQPRIQPPPRVEAPRNGGGENKPRGRKERD